mmetsp:Transcript_1752/g.2391  ORF Transcript_1752/g.2391 Transcript_1752/m.2391 type:complete len:130 (-) Transcript_1752:203-592(-)|eukprot:CAMPEP_0201478924 /NCGR_PEP_ID=MMETSP0151_2-20130828/3681_1 /ASSEMBLY_ACC=CAM_ASM_000257 /TAXON_ID=200890 /ORGANISM="Paramoeba atlantica, Strain 621/1 / CCAP 1560/9" /LENGTH=129 /DNA_ID=CAMNT_0047860185 /DNA_START=130 /DNA_END=519 /DNA_ORIENTATION=-
MVDHEVEMGEKWGRNTLAHLQDELKSDDLLSEIQAEIGKLKTDGGTDEEDPERIGALHNRKSITSDSVATHAKWRLNEQGEQNDRLITKSKSFWGQCFRASNLPRGIVLVLAIFFFVRSLNLLMSGETD